VASLLKRWLAGTHQSGVSAEHLQAYLDEFTFRFTRRHSRARGLLFLRLLEGAVTTPPTTMRELIKVPNPHPVRNPRLHDPSGRKALQQSHLTAHGAITDRLNYCRDPDSPFKECRQ